MAGLQNLIALYAVLDRETVKAGSGGATAPECLDPALKGVKPGWSSPTQEGGGAVTADGDRPDVTGWGGSDATAAGSVVVGRDPTVMGGGGPAITEYDDSYVQEYVGIEGAPDAAAVPPSQNVDEVLNAITEGIGDGGGLTTPDRARYFAALIGLAQMIPAARAATGRAQIDLSASEPFINALAAIGPREVALDRRATRVRDVAPDLLALTDRANASDGSRMLAAYAVHRGLLPADTLLVGTCSTHLASVNGYQCVVIDTFCGAPDVSLDALQSIVNPFNWAANYSEFFQAMEPLRPWGIEGWTRVRETVALLGIDGVNEVTTHLRFHTSEDRPATPGWSGRGPASARIDYDLDVKYYELDDAPYNRDNDPLVSGGPVNVDRGWINMWTNNSTNDPSQPGVRFRTKKIVQIDDVNPEFQRVALGPLGYGKASAEFLLGPAKAPPSSAHPFIYRGWPAPVPPGSPPPPPPTDQSPPPTAPTSQPAGNSPHFARSAVQIWTDTAKQMTTDYAVVAGRWTTGQLTPTELADYAATTTNRLIRAPFAFLEQMTQVRVPPTGNSTNQGGGES